MPQMTIKSVGVFSVAKIQAAIMAVFGLIIGVIYGLFFMVFGAALLSQSGSAPGAGGAVLIGILMMIGIPIMYGAIGFVAGAIGALIYNVAAGFTGGIELEVESASLALSAPPSPPAQWTPNQYQQGPAPY